MQLRSFSFEFLHVSPFSITGLVDLSATASTNRCIADDTTGSDHLFVTVTTGAREETAFPFPREGARDRESRPGRRGGPCGLGCYHISFTRLDSHYVLDGRNGTALKHLCSKLHLRNLNMHICSLHYVTSAF
ncbi:BQ5605_C002g01440 [Microbotryum silenes-dioicae]|uniref:BQ5605_C002g01440 protein n=1 Tax=Microbotryum silenes-dioicae TaxID=796604 RepID=A0A2X0M378_9BASI|nr:BQ5605_C002g01440 [Microbotryum silenes-dioicae]